MGQSRLVELVVGLFVCIGVAAAFFLTFNVSNFDSADDGTYTIKGYFTNVKGVKKGTAVDISGVVVGRITDITVQKFKDGSAMNEVVVSMAIKDEYKLPTDTEAKILTAGLLGEKYVGLMIPAREKTQMKDGDILAEAHSTVVFEEIIGKVVTSLTESEKDTGPTETDKMLAKLLEQLSKQNIGN